MVKLINNITGTEMWVHETRLDEYLAAGHILPTPPPPPQTEPKPRKTRKKASP